MSFALQQITHFKNFFGGFENIKRNHILHTFK